MELVLQVGDTTVSEGEHENSNENRRSIRKGGCHNIQYNQYTQSQKKIKSFLTAPFNSLLSSDS